jgi:hypothetical protein
MQIMSKTKKMGRKPLKKNIQKNIVELAGQNKTDLQILSIIPNISQSSVSRVKKSNRELIEEKKKKYIAMIDKSTGGDTKQATILSQSLNANTEIYNFKGELIGTRPDHKQRLETIKYIDKLKGRELPSLHLTQNNTIIAKELDKFIK